VKALFILPLLSGALLAPAIARRRGDPRRRSHLSRRPHGEAGQARDRGRTRLAVWKIGHAKYTSASCAKGQLVEVQAVSDGAYRVRGLAQQGQVLGWIEPRYLSPLKPEFLANLKQKRRTPGGGGRR
jgi:hypothetical protein